MSEEMKCPVKYGIQPKHMGISAFTKSELESIGAELESKEPVEGACVWIWSFQDNPNKYFVALRTGGAGRGRGKVLLSALCYTQPALIEAVEKFSKMQELVA